MSLHRAPILLGALIVSLLLVGVGCRSNNISGTTGAAFYAPTFPQSCGPNHTTVGYRNPATQACESSPAASQELTFSAFDLLYSSADSSPTAVTLATIRFNENLHTQQAIAVLNAVRPTDNTTFALRLPSIRGGTSFPLEVTPAERSTLTAIHSVIDQVVASRGYTASELAELHRAVSDDPVVAGVVVRAAMRDLQTFWHENPTLVRTITFDLPIKN